MIQLIYSCECVAIKSGEMIALIYNKKAIDFPAELLLSVLNKPYFFIFLFLPNVFSNIQTNNTKAGMAIIDSQVEIFTYT